MVAVGGEDVGIECRARIRLLFTAALGLNLEVVVGAGCDLAHLGLVSIGVQVKCRLKEHINAGFLRLRVSLRLDTAGVGVHELGLQVHLLADEIRVARGVSYIRLIHVQQLVDFLYELGAHVTRRNFLRDRVELDSSWVRVGSVIRLNARLAVDSPVKQVLPRSEGLGVHGCTEL